MVRRTDLAVEAHQLWMETAEDSTPDGVETEERVQEGFSVTAVTVTSETGSKALGKPLGRYISMELDGLLRREPDAFPRAVRAIAVELRALLTIADKPVLVIGLGNRAITPDLLGPLAVEQILVTRHLVEQEPAYFGHYRAVSAMIPGVLASTGLESAEIAAAAVGTAQPAAIIVIDALASRSLERVCRTVQLSDSGITPGSGVGNHRTAIDCTTMGIPVYTIGVPTVVDGATLALDILAQAGVETLEPEALHGQGCNLFVTPREIDVQIATLAKVIGYGINLALQPHLSLTDLEMLLE